MTEPRPADSPRVGLLFDSVSENTGDAAIGIAVAQELARHGIGVGEVVDPFGPRPRHLDALVVGGGELIRPEGDEFYDRFRVAGATMLNAVGVWEDARNLEYLRDYALVSARSTVEAERLGRFVDSVRVLPCTTTTLRGERYEIEGLEPGEPVVGIHVVPHTLALCPEVVEIVNAIPARKVLIPFTHYNFDDSFMAALPFEGPDIIRLPRLRPLQLHSVIGQMSFVVVSSLHASIFAYSQNVPFASAHQEKVFNYFADRGLGDFVFRDEARLRDALARIHAGEVDFKVRVAQDRRLVEDAFAELARHVPRGTFGAQSPGVVEEAEHTNREQADRILLAQRGQVIVDRDRVVASLVRNAANAEVEISRWHREADRLAADGREWRQEAERLGGEVDAWHAEADRLAAALHEVELKNNDLAARFERLVNRSRAGVSRRAKGLFLRVFGRSG